MFLLKLELENVRSLERLDLSFEGGEVPTRRWTMLLGENGCGKSTILKSVALLMAGSNALPELLGKPDTWIRLGSKSCLFRAHLVTAAGERRTVEFTLHRGDRMLDVFERNKDTLRALDHALAHAFRNYMTVGYGVSRRFSPPGQAVWKEEQFRSKRAQAVATMFSPDATLQSLQSWAMDIHYRRSGAGLRTVKDTLDGLLPGITFDRIDREEKQVLFRTPDGIVPLEHLSDGYQNVAAWCGDLVYRVTDLNPDYKNPLQARGLLLIDEIDLHLHPVWQRRLREYINHKFPKLQILASTHSPLTAQQCQEGELFSLQRPRQGASPILAPFPGDPQKLMVHQLMLNPMFGLDTLDSRQTQEDREAYRSLSRRRKLSSPDRQRLSDLKQTLQNIPDWSTQSLADQEELLLLRDIRSELQDRDSNGRRGARSKKARAPKARA